MGEYHFGQIVLARGQKRILISQHLDDPYQFEASSFLDNGALSFPGTIVTPFLDTGETLSIEQIKEGFTIFDNETFADTMIRGYNKEFK